MRHAKLFVVSASAAALSTLVLSSCGGGSSNPAGGGGSGGSGGQAAACMNAKIVAAESSNYAFSSTLTFPPVKVKPSTEWTFDWNGLSRDFLGHSVNTATDINMVVMMLWKLPLATLQTKLNADALAMSDLAVLPLSLKLDGKKTSATTYTLTLNGNPITPTELSSYLDPTVYPPASNTYTLMVATGTTLGQGVRMIQSFQLDPASTNTNVTLTDDSTKLTYMANLHSLTPVGITRGTAAVTLDWGTMKTNALGNPFILTNITDALVGHFTQTPTELEGKFLDLETSTAEMYNASIDSGTVLDFSTLKTKDGKSFAGIDDTGTWIVALKCGGCRNPAPWYLTILKPC